jgi:hypothetical protein
MPPLFSRRAFLRAAVGLGLMALAPPTPATPGTGGSQTRPDEPRVYFTPLEDYHELPADCYAQNLIRPGEIILHWDGNAHGRELWKVQITYETLSYVLQSSHFAVDDKRVWQMLPMYQTLVQESYGAKGYNWIAINVEMAGRDFDLPEFYPAETQIRLTLRLISHLMDFYAIPFEKVFGHFERDDRDLKQDPGVKFMADFRERLKAYRTSLSPLKRSLVASGA